LARLTAPGQTYQIGAKPPGETLESPALTMHRYGAGTVAFCALPLATDLWKRGNPGAKYVLQEMARRVTPQITLERLGPPCVQVTHAEGDQCTVVHLVAYQPDRRTGPPQVIESPGLMSGLLVRLRESRNPKSVRADPQRLALRAERQGDWLQVAVPPFLIHTAIVFEWYA
jgi:hypothetical protein